jgi:hypothetical protein
MAKLTRESRLRERRAEKAAKKEARRMAPPHEAEQPGEALSDDANESADPGTEQPVR